MPPGGGGSSANLSTNNPQLQLSVITAHPRPDRQWPTAVWPTEGFCFSRTVFIKNMYSLSMSKNQNISQKYPHFFKKKRPQNKEKEYLTLECFIPFRAMHSTGAERWLSL